MLSFPSLTACRPLCCYAITLSQHAVGTCKASCAYYLLFFFLKHPVGTVPLLRNEYLKERWQLNNWGAPLDYVSWRKDSENSGCPQKLKNAGSAGIIQMWDGNKTRSNPMIGSHPVYWDTFISWRRHRCILHCLWYPTIMCVWFRDSWGKILKIISGWNLTSGHFVCRCMFLNDFFQ